MDQPVLVIILFIFALLVAPKNLVSTTKFDAMPDFKANESSGGCEFPESWRGQWLHLGFPQPLNISKHFITSKGSCLQRSESKFIVAEKYNCVKCMVIHEKHPNVLQYKESFCDPLSRVHQSNEISVDELCQTIESDSALFFMFRHPPQPASCPFEGVHGFSYSTRGGKDKCNSDPPSRIDSCTNQSKMVLKYQACPDVPGSETSDEILECIAGWKEGSSRYLVGRLQPLSHSSSLRPSSSSSSASSALSSSSVVPSYQCFRYEHHVEDGRIVTKMSQSFRGSCEGLWSAEEGDKTYTLWQVDTELMECGLPSWLVSRPTWTTMDSRMHLEMRGGGSRRFTLTTTRRKRKTRKRLLDKLDNREDEHASEGGGETDKVSSHMTCHNIVHQNATFVKLVVYQKLECTSGYRCFELNQMHLNIIHMRMGNRSRHADEACSQHFFSSSSQPIRYLIPEGSSEDCPFLGRFEEVNEKIHEAQQKQDQQVDSNKGGAWSFRNKDKMATPDATVNTAAASCHSWLQSGCPLNNNMVIHQCAANNNNNSVEENTKQDQIRDVTCVGHWPMVALSIDNNRVQSISSNHETSNHAENLTDSLTKSNPVPILPNSPTHLIVQERSGLARCVEYSRISGEDRPKLSVKIFEAECNENVWMSRADLVYQGACQEALTDVTSISGGTGISIYPWRNCLLFFPTILVVKFWSKNI